ncbi:MAG: RraA family protein [Vicinamibacterales bacterium]
MKRTPDLDGFEWSTPFIADGCVQLGMAVRVGPPGLRPMLPGTRVAGRVCPCRHSGSVDVFMEAVVDAGQGDVLVIDNDGRLDEGCIGDLAAGEAREAGLSGVIVWGLHRDTAALLALGIRLWSLGTCPAGPSEMRERSPKALVSARLGAGSLVTREDIVFADDDGVVVVEAAKVDRVIEAAKDIAAREGAHATRLLAGELLRDQFKLEAYVAQRRKDPSFTFREHLKSLGGAIEV